MTPSSANDKIPAMDSTEIKRVCILLSRNYKSDHEHLNGALRFAENRPDWDIRILNTSSRTFRKDLRSAVKGWSPDGIIYSSPEVCIDVLRLTGNAKNIALAEIDFPDPRIVPDVRIVSDGREIGCAAARHFIERGYSHLAYYGCSSNREAEHSRLRRESFRKEASDHKATFSSFEPSTAQGSWTTLTRETGNWLKMLPKPCGIFAFADEEARELYRSCRNAGVQIPSQIAVLGVDNELDLCETIHPAISSIHPDFEGAGFLAAAELDKAMNGKRRSGTKTFSYGILNLIPRESTSDIDGRKRIVSAAMQLIRNHARDGITVTAMAKRLNISCRLLEIHFRAVIGSSPGTELRKYRLGLLSDLLVKSDMTVGEAAAMAGFRSTVSAQVAFKKHFGVSMRNFKNLNATPAGRKRITHARRNPEDLI